METTIVWNDVKEIGKPTKEGYYFIKVIQGEDGEIDTGYGIGYFAIENNEKYWDGLSVNGRNESYCGVIAWAEIPND